MGDDMVNGKFVLKNNDKAVYYYDKNAKDDEGKSVTSYDVRIFYTDTDGCGVLSRDLPFAKIKQLFTLRMDGTGEDALPFATYLSEGSTKEYVSVNDVKRRVGMTDTQDDEDSDSENSDSQDNNSDSSQTNPTPTPDSDSTDNPDDGSNNGGDDGGTGEDPVAVAESFMGQSLDALKGACGDPSGSDYQDEPETGKTGISLLYNRRPVLFTVSTTVDENGNEIVAGVW